MFIGAQRFGVFGIRSGPTRVVRFEPMRAMKSSFSDRLQIAALSPPGITGVIGLTLCPGKKDPGRDWDRDLDIDLTVIEQWGAEVVVTLVEAP